MNIKIDFSVYINIPTLEKTRTIMGYILNCRTVLLSMQSNKSSV